MNREAPDELEGSPLGSPVEIASTSRAVREMFEAVSPRYDFLNHLLSAGFDIYWRKITARCARQRLASPGSIAVDVCCGTGDLASALRRVSAGEVIAADFCQPMLQRAREKFRRTSARVALLGADALELPFADNSVDVVTSAFGFRNLANYALGLREIRRVLKPSGIAAILEFSRVQWPVFGPLFRFYFAHILPRVGTWVSGVRGPYQYLHESASRFPNQEALARTMRRAGFTNVRYRNLLGGVAALHQAEKPGGAMIS
jgi:demethylmenaquinone methyltransferase / 2-methoxy-6-polyprenyl-1,4-benzoquinol methylase